MAHHCWPVRPVHDESLTYARRFFKWGFSASRSSGPLITSTSGQPFASHILVIQTPFSVALFLYTIYISVRAAYWENSWNKSSIIYEFLAMEDSKTGNGGNKKKFTCSKFHWKPEEDILLTTLVKRFGPNNWELIAKHFPGRTGKSCRLRWVNQLDPQINKMPFSVEEKRRVLELHQCYGNKWSIISKHFVRRTDNQVKNQYHVLVGSRTVRASSPPSGDNPEDTPKDESMNLSQFQNVSIMAFGSQVSNISYNRDNNSGFVPCSDVIPYRVEVPFIDSGPSVYGKDEMWYAASGSDPGIIGPHTFDNANLGYIGADQNTIWDDAMNSDVSYTELLNLPLVSPPQHGYVKDHNFIDFFGLEKP